MRRSRPVREHDPEWFWLGRAWAASWKTWVLAGLGVAYGLALAVGGIWAVTFGVAAAVAALYLLKQLAEERRGR